MSSAIAAIHEHLGPRQAFLYCLHNHVPGRGNGRLVKVNEQSAASLDIAVKQLRKLVNVVEVINFKEGQAVIRELVLVKVRADAKSRYEIMQISDIFRSKIVNVAQDDVIIELTGDEGKVGAFLALIEPFGIIELSRTGQLALTRR